MLAVMHVEAYHTLCFHYIIGGRMFVCLFVCLSICLFVCLSACLFVCLFFRTNENLVLSPLCTLDLAICSDCNSSQYVTTGGG